MARMSADSLVRMRALAHPVRLQLLSLLTGSPMCAAEAGRWLQMSQANVSYHLRMLERAGLVEVAEEVSIRGGRARRYRHVPTSEPDRPGHAPSLTELESEQAFVDVLIAELRRRHPRRAAGPATMVDAELWVDAATWKEIVAAMGAASARLHARARPPGSAGTVRVSATLSMFQMKP